MIKTFFSSNNLQYTDKNFFNLTFKLLSMIELQNFNKFEYWDETIKIIKYFFKGYEIKTEEDKLFTLTCNLFVNIDLKDFKDEKAGQKINKLLYPYAKKKRGKWIKKIYYCTCKLNKLCPGCY